MKKYTKVLIVCSIFALCIVGCQKAENTGSTNTETTKNTETTESQKNTELVENTETEENTESVESTENVAEQETPETESQDTATSDETSPTEEELAWFETSFFNTAENRIVNLFLASEYHDAKDVDLYELFYNGSGKDDALASTEEVQLLKARYDIMDLDVFKVTTNEINDILKKYIGMTLEETNKNNLDGLYYLEEYDAYYNVAGDTNYMQYDFSKLLKNADGTVSIEYMNVDLFNGVEKAFILTLKEVDGSYQFVSNKAAE